MFKKIKRYIYKLTHPIIGEVWQLHRVTDSHADSDLQRKYEITPNRLEKLILLYLKNGYEFISMNDVCSIINGEKKLRNKFVSITFDDGYMDNFEIAYPILKRYNIPFCIYLLQNEVSGIKKGSYTMLSKEQIYILDKDSLCTFGGHTYSHPRLSELTIEEQRKEILLCKDWIENLLGHEIIDYSYPFGSFNEDSIRIMHDVGIKHCTMAWGGEIRKKKYNLLTIPRKLITENEII